MNRINWLGVAYLLIMGVALLLLGAAIFAPHAL